MLSVNNTEPQRVSLKKSYVALATMFVLILSTSIMSGCSVPTEEDALKTRMLNATMDIETYNSMKPQLTQGIDLNKAIELGLKYNLELWLAKQELSIKKEIKSGAIAKMLPQLTADINVGLRDSHNATSSIGLFTGENAELSSYSYSDMKSHTYGGVNLLWNVIDFGVSYYRVKQESKRTQHALHEIRRIRQKLAYEITQAYWQCASMELIVNKSIQIESEVDAELSSIAESLRNNRITSSVAIERRYPLKSQKIKINDYKELYQAARLRLAQLMGLPVGADFSVISYIDKNIENSFNVEELERVALNLRPELFQEDLEESITHDEAKATILKMLPSPQLFLNPAADDNKHLYYDSWISAGLNVSWNLLDIPSKIFNTKAQYKRMDFIRKKRMALAVAIITQLRIAAIEYDFAVTRYRSLNDLASDSNMMIRNAEKASKAGKGKKSAIINKKLNALRDFAASMEAYTRVMVAKARILNTVGADPTGSDNIIFAQPSLDINSAENQNVIYITDSTEPVETITELADSKADYTQETIDPATETFVLEQYGKPATAIIQ